MPGAAPGLLARVATLRREPDDGMAVPQAVRRALDGGSQYRFDRGLLRGARRWGSDSGVEFRTLPVPGGDGRRPPAQRQGIGGRLLEPVLEIAHRDRVDCVLETAEPRDTDDHARTVSWPRTRPCSGCGTARPHTVGGGGMTDEPDFDERETNGNGGTNPMKATPTLYEWAGGEAAIRRLMDCFYDRVERDPLLSPYFPGGVSEEHRAHVSAWWSEVLGGPARYTEDLGGYERCSLTIAASR